MSPYEGRMDIWYKAAQGLISVEEFLDKFPSSAAKYARSSVQVDSSSSWYYAALADKHDPTVVTRNQVTLDYAPAYAPPPTPLSLRTPSPVNLYKPLPAPPAPYFEYLFADAELGEKKPVGNDSIVGHHTQSLAQRRNFARPEALQLRETAAALHVVSSARSPARQVSQAVIIGSENTYNCGNKGFDVESPCCCPVSPSDLSVADSDATIYCPESPIHPVASFYHEVENEEDEYNDETESLPDSEFMPITDDFYNTTHVNSIEHDDNVSMTDGESVAEESVVDEVETASVLSVEQPEQFECFRSRASFTSIINAHRTAQDVINTHGVDYCHGVPETDCHYAQYNGSDSEQIYPDCPRLFQIPLRGTKRSAHESLILPTSDDICTDDDDVIYLGTKRLRKTPSPLQLATKSDTASISDKSIISQFNEILTRPIPKGYLGQFTGKSILPRHLAVATSAAAFGDPLHPNGVYINKSFRQCPLYPEMEYSPQTLPDESSTYSAIRYATKCSETAATEASSRCRSQAEENLRREAHFECTSARLEGVGVGKYRYYQGHLTVEEYIDARMCVCWDWCACAKLCTRFGDLICPCNENILLPKD